MLSISVVWLSQDSGIFGFLRSDPSLGGFLGTAGEGLAALAQAAQNHTELADIAPDLADQARCAVGILSDRQHRPEAAQPIASPYLDGGWVIEGRTRMDYQQHALSALLGVLRLTDRAAG